MCMLAYVFPRPLGLGPLIMWRLLLTKNYHPNLPVPSLICNWKRKGGRTRTWSFECILSHLVFFLLIHEGRGDVPAFIPRFQRVAGITGANPSYLYGRGWGRVASSSQGDSRGCHTRCQLPIRSNFGESIYYNLLLWTPLWKAMFQHAHAASLSIL